MTLGEPQGLCSEKDPWFMMIHDDSWLLTALEQSLWIVISLHIWEWFRGSENSLTWKSWNLEESDATWDRRQDREGNIYWSNKELQIRFFETSDLEFDHVTSSTGTDGRRHCSWKLFETARFEKIETSKETYGPWLKRDPFWIATLAEEK